MNTEALDLDALCAKAQAATPGPWEVRPYTGDSDPEYVGPIAGEEITTESGDTVLTQLGCSCCDFGLEGRPEDAAHIAAFDPPTVLALIARLRAAEEVVSRIPTRYDLAHAIARSLPGWNEDTSEPTLEGPVRSATEAHWERINAECLRQGREAADVMLALIHKGSG